MAAIGYLTIKPESGIERDPPGRHDREWGTPSHHLRNRMSSNFGASSRIGNPA